MISNERKAFFHFSPARESWALGDVVDVRFSAPIMSYIHRIYSSTINKPALKNNFLPGRDFYYVLVHTLDIMGFSLPSVGFEAEIIIRFQIFKSSGMSLSSFIVFFYLFYVSGG